MEGLALAMPVPPKLWTYEDYAALPDDGKRYEVLEGELLEVSAPSFWHQDIAGVLYRALGNYLEEHPAGRVAIAPLDVILGKAKTNVVQPDVVYISNEREAIITRENVQGAPDLAVEVLSPTSEERDFVHKRRIYARHGVQEYWIVFQAVPRIEIYRLEVHGRFGKPMILEAGDEATTPLLPGFRLPVMKLYAKLPGFPQFTEEER